LRGSFDTVNGSFGGLDDKRLTSWNALMISALVEVGAHATCEERWLTHATGLADELIERFSDAEHGGFYSTAGDGERVRAASALRRPPAIVTQPADVLAHASLSDGEHRVERLVELLRPATPVTFFCPPCGRDRPSSPSS
jgi:hypothetical protein